MDHVLVRAKAAVTTDKGEFTAIAAAYSLDRVGDRIVPGAFEATIKSWQESGKRIPLHWDHESGPESIIGSIDPASVKETDAGLEVSGTLDLENSEKAREAWRAIKTDSMSLSFGYMVTDQREGKDGANELLGLDLFEVSVAPGPANADTRFLSLKSAKAMTPAEMLQEIEAMRSRLSELEAAMRTEERGEMGAEPETKTSTPEGEKTEIEEREDEELEEPSPRRQDPLADEIEDLWLATAAAPLGGSNVDAERASP